MKNFNNIYNFDNLKENFFFNSELELRTILSNFLNEDIGTGDITSNLLIPKEKTSSGTIVCKHEDIDRTIIASGLAEAKMIFEICGCNAIQMVEDGSVVSKGTEVMSVSGSARSILKAERTALNIVMRMSGISTKTRQFVEKLGDLSQVVRIASTRKTAPGLRYFDKKAVVLGGGISHRKRMDQLILIKDNHIAIVGSVKKAIELAKSVYGEKRKIECEVVNLDGIVEAIRSGADIVMLDNFTSDMVRYSLEKIREYGLREKAVIEISGGVNYDNIYDYASSRPDVISIGSLTHSVKSIDYSLEISN